MIVNGRRNQVLQPVISIPLEAESIEISESGVVFVQLAAQTQPTEVGQLQIARFMNPAALKAKGNGLLVATEASGDAIVGAPNKPHFGSIQQGYLERSNVNIPTELLELKRIRQQLAAITEAKRLLTVPSSVATRQFQPEKPSQATKSRLR